MILNMSIVEYGNSYVFNLCMYLEIAINMLSFKWLYWIQFFYEILLLM